MPRILADLRRSNIIQRGLSFPRRAFWVHLKCKAPEFDDATLGFTTDNRLILGLSIDDIDAKSENLSKAKGALQELAQKYDGFLCLVSVELPPPRNELQFRELAKAGFTGFFY